MDQIFTISITTTCDIVVDLRNSLFITVITLYLRSSVSSPVILKTPMGTVLFNPILGNDLSNMAIVLFTLSTTSLIGSYIRVGSNSAIILYWFLIKMVKVAS